MATIDYARLPFRQRPDLTPYVIHLTRAAGGDTGLDVLTKILKDGVIRGSSPGESFIKGQGTLGPLLTRQ